MSDDLYLIAHKVRGEPAFDVAIHCTCPKCNATDDHCTACDGAGHWWIIPTSGHRAFPWWHCDLYMVDGDALYSNIDDHPFEHMPPSLRDHYTTEREAAFDLAKALGFDKPATPRAPILRRL